jgi:hypothetical protein
MFEITGDDIASLSDGDLRTLVVRLALAELSAQNLPLSSVTAGGNQDAADGGLDVRVDCAEPFTKPDFVPRTLTGYQVKKSDMPPSAIRDEMRPDGVLRPVIRQLADASGAYVIVSAQGSVTDKALDRRRNAIRDQLDLSTGNQLKTDFYDRERLANWANAYPGVAAWIRRQSGRDMEGWDSVGSWLGPAVQVDGDYLFDDTACLIDERSRGGNPISISDAIATLRAELRVPKRCVRLIGQSGLGKTRLVQALFETGVGEAPLDPGLALYADYSIDPKPAARDMAQQLITSGQRAILIIDNCNPATHSELARICSQPASNVSLLTVEYDVRDDEPEHTEVFRLQSVSNDLVEKWVEQMFPAVSPVDRRRIAEFSDGNFRIAGVLAGTLRTGESLGELKDSALFNRIFWQRHPRDQSLKFAAEDLSLFYSLDGEDVSTEGELAHVACIRRVDADALYAALAELKHRGIVQSRGRWRAILPQAIANRLAASALARIAPIRLDELCVSLPPRMRRSMARRIGHLHNSSEAQAAVGRWLASEGALGDLFALGEDGLGIVTSIAPVAPELTLARVEQELSGRNEKVILEPNTGERWQWIHLIKALGYEPSMFETVAMLLARFVAAEPHNKRLNSAEGAFVDLFHLQLSGTQATPDQRRQVIRRLAVSPDLAQRRCAELALDALLSDRFSSSSSFEFGARPRDWGWAPKLNRDVWDWYNAAINLAVELSPSLAHARDILARHIRSLWLIGPCNDTLERAAIVLARNEPWLKGWLGFRASRKFHGQSMPDEVRERLDVIIERLRPRDLLNRARAVVLDHGIHGLDIVDGEPHDDQDVERPYRRAALMAQDVGRGLAKDPQARGNFLAELQRTPNAPRAYECGRGLADATDDLSEMWKELADGFSAAESSMSYIRVLAGFIHDAYARQPDFVLSALDAAADDQTLKHCLPYLQAEIGIDASGIARLRLAISGCGLQVATLRCLAFGGVISHSPPQELGDLLHDVAALSGGVLVAVEVLSMRFFSDRSDKRPYDQRLIRIGRQLLCGIDFGDQASLQHLGYAVGQLLQACCSGADGAQVARDLCMQLAKELASMRVHSVNIETVLKALFKVQPLIALDEFLLYEPTSHEARPLESIFEIDALVENVGASALTEWADGDAAARYSLLGRTLSMFQRKRGDESNKISPLFLQFLEQAPDKRDFLGSWFSRIHPSGWIGSLAGVLAQRRESLLALRNSPHAEVRQWVDEAIPELDKWIRRAREREHEEEERFE